MKLEAALPVWDQPEGVMQKEALTDKESDYEMGTQSKPWWNMACVQWEFQWRWGIQQLRRTRKIFTLQQTKDVLTVQHVSVEWGGHSLLSYLQKCTCSAGK